ncbi:hypothetical protein TMM008_41480 [Pseudomonas sp. 008]|nr:hypothetical protein TMM008_41480 [Pseudomonas sp. 008]
MSWHSSWEFSSIRVRQTHRRRRFDPGAQRGTYQNNQREMQESGGRA